MHTITIKSDKPIVVIPIEEYESMRETIELFSANPYLLEELGEERRKMERGDFISFKDFKKKYKVNNASNTLVKKHGEVLGDSSKEKSKVV